LKSATVQATVRLPDWVLAADEAFDRCISAAPAVSGDVLQQGAVIDQMLELQIDPPWLQQSPSPE
jgi:hypothetical protein